MLQGKDSASTSALVEQLQAAKPDKITFQQTNTKEDFQSALEAIEAGTSNPKIDLILLDAAHSDRSATEAQHVIHDTFKTPNPEVAMIRIPAQYGDDPRAASKWVLEQIGTAIDA